MMTQDDKKKAAAWAALKFVPQDSIIGVGTGSTANHFIEALGSIKDQIKGAVASSNESAKALQALGITVFDANEVTELEIYVDGADEINPQLQMIKGGGAALTREKIVAALAKRFICIIDDSKKVPVLGKFALPVEVIPMARSYVGRELFKLGGNPCYREGCITDNGNIIIDVHDLEIRDPKALETQINGITGVVTVGLFAHRGANIILEGTQNGVVETLA